MKTYRNLILTSLSLIVTTLTYSVTEYEWTETDVDGTGSWLDGDYDPDYKYLASWGSHSDYQTYNGIFDLREDGYDSSKMSVLGGTVFFAFADDGDAFEWLFGDYQVEFFDITVGGSTLWEDWDVDGSHYNSPHNYSWYQTSLTPTLIAELQDGLLEYSVKATNGDAYLKEARIEAYGNSVRVPDAGTTAILLVIAVLGLVFLARMLKPKQKIEG